MWQYINTPAIYKIYVVSDSGCNIHHLPISIEETSSISHLPSSIFHLTSKRNLPSSIFHLPSYIEEASSIEESVLKYVITS